MEHHLYIALGGGGGGGGTIALEGGQYLLANSVRGGQNPLVDSVRGNKICGQNLRTKSADKICSDAIKN